LDGLYEEFYVNGQCCGRGNYKDGKEDGLYEAFYESGECWGRDRYKNGRLIKENKNG
jgi:antitoxin component YwqK of YwqJK toxin-antitoxin module